MCLGICALGDFGCFQVDLTWGDLGGFWVFEYFRVLCCVIEAFRVRLGLFSGILGGFCVTWVLAGSFEFWGIWGFWVSGLV